MTVRLIVGEQADWVPEWLAEKLDIDEGFGIAVSMGIVDGPEILGAVLFNNYRHPNIEATIATLDPRWCSRRILRGIFSYPFGQLGCSRVTAITKAMNQPARAFLCRLGFQEEGTVRHLFVGNVDGIVHGMLAEECRWFRAGEQMRRVAA